jgi:hypothetical protein
MPDLTVAPLRRTTAASIQPRQCQSQSFGRELTCRCAPWASCGPRQPIIRAETQGDAMGRNGTLRYPRRSGRTRDRQSGLSAPCPLARLLILACARVQVPCIQLTRRRPCDPQGDRACLQLEARWFATKSWFCLFPPAPPRVLLPLLGPLDPLGTIAPTRDPCAH